MNPRQWQKIAIAVGIAGIAFLGCIWGTGCTILREYPRRSELTLKLSAHNGVGEPERTADSVMVLHGSNRDILQSYTAAMDFTLERLGLKKGIGK